MSFQDTSSRWREINSPIPLEGGKFSWRGQLYAPVRRQGEHTYEPIILKLKLPPFPHSKTNLRFWFFTYLFLCTTYTITVLAIWNFPPITSFVLVAGYVLTPLVFVGWFGWWLGGRWNRRVITSLRDFPGTKEEWIKILRKELKLETDSGGYGWVAIIYALELTGKRERLLKMGYQEILCASIAWLAVLLCFHFGGELVGFERNWELLRLFRVTWCIMLLGFFFLGVMCRKSREFDKRVGEIKKNCEHSADEEKSEKASIVALEWLVERLLVVEGDWEERTQERREVIIDPILKRIR